MPTRKRSTAPLNETIKKQTTPRPKKRPLGPFSEVKAERDFLLHRLTLASDPFKSADEIGISSNAMVLIAITYRQPAGDAYFPSDPSDLRRCENTYATAPEHLQKRMLPILQMYRRWVAKRYPEVGIGEPIKSEES